MMPRLLTLLLFLVMAASALAGGVHRRSTAPVVRAAMAQTRPGNDEKALLVYPNPSNGIVHLTINGQEGRRVEIQVLNVIGSVVYREQLSELNERDTRVLDLSRFVNGLYYVKMQGEGTSQICKLVIR